MIMSLICRKKKKKKKKIPLLKKIIFKTILGLDTEGYQSWILVPMVVNQ